MDISPPSSADISVWYLRPKAVFVLILFFFVTIYGIAAYLSLSHYQIQRNHIIASKRTTADLISFVVNEHQKAAVNLLQSYAIRPLVIIAAKDRRPDRILQHLVQLKHENAEIDTMIVTDIRGTLWASYPSRPEVQEHNFSHRDWYRGVSSTWHPYVSSAFRRVVGEKDIAVVVAVPIFDTQGKPIHILAAAQRLTLLAELIQKVPSERYEQITLADQAGTMLYSNTFPYRDKLSPYPYRNAISSALRDRTISTILHHGTDKSTLHTTVAPVEQTGWHVIVSISDSGVLRAEFPYIVQIFMICSLIFLLILVFFLYVRKDILARRMAERLAIENREREAAEALRERDAYIRVVLDHLPIGIAVNTISPKVKFEYMNDLFPRFYQTTKEALSDPDTFWEAVYEEPEFREAIKKRVLADCASGDPDRMIWEDVPIVRTNEETKFITAQNIPIPGKPLVISTVRDVTKRKNAENALSILNEDLERRVAERTVQLEAVNRELDAFSYSVSHDLRAPLRSIDGFSQALLEDCANQLDDTGKRHLERIRRATQRMGLLIDDMLKLARLTKTDLHKKNTNLTNIATRIIESLRQSDPDRRVETVIQENVYASADPRLSQVLLENLLDNAWKFTGKNPQARIEFGSLNMDGETVFFIRDNGVGFNMAYIDKLFAAFQRLHAQHEFPGTGIGLATVQRIVNRHRGRIWAESEEGKGAAFFFVLPDPPEH